ncbi:ATP phosphoribosyltransferase [Aphanomyces invadans]|uniref:ATP phosphoribosyltransferase n=1 Tax=Aphanomyces invadans TaxID=157072 RepID=A0A024TDN6_9STRA|nr:ATP phosphoribosyltransferase [Aphanomyces invadans]ETV91711.1 ATP phosphoribosyltransferase [Aphanomyces invadans]|eukprot:XP_008879637.1 ATP phosphoribosyltransferase [Aphanomyces invadans]
MADMSSTENNLLFAVPKKGRLHDQVVKFLNGAGLDYTRPHRLDIAHCSSLPVTVVFLPASDIAAYVGEGNVDLGITGQDIIAESQTTVNELMNLGFGKCSLSVQAPITSAIKDPALLAGKRIVTSFPNVAREYFKQFEVPGKPTHIKYVGGSVEAACGLGLADGIVDLVETGTTMKAAGLEIVSNIMKTEAVLISNPNTKHRKLVNKIHQRLLGFLFAQKYRMISYNIAREKLQKAITITPGRKAPTINPLLNEDFCAVSAMVPRNDVADIMDDLHELGATDIFVLDIENCRA